MRGVSPNFSKKKKSLPRRSAEKTSLFLLVMAHEFERLCDLHHDDGHDGKPDADDVGLPGQIFAAEAEHRHDARREHDERDERERDERDDVEELVRERPHFEEGVPRTHVVGVERLREGEHKEGGGAACLIPETESEAGDAVACERQSCEHTALQHDLDAVAVGEDTFAF